MSLAGGGVKGFSIEPEPPEHPDRIPITDAHKKNVSDPMTGSLVRVSGAGEPVGPEGCAAGQQAVFDGRMRYDLRLAFKRMDKVKAEKGYQGPVVICSVAFTPLAGHIPTRPVIQYLSSLQDSEVWLAPVAGTRVVVPFRISVPTPVGDAVLEATQFVVTPAPRATPTSAKAL